MRGLIRVRERIFVLALIAMVKPLRKDWKNLLPIRIGIGIGDNLNLWGFIAQFSHDATNQFFC
jgi:hypothetical protein